MPKSATITLTLAGADTGPFNLFSDADGFVTPFESNVPKSSLVAGYTTNLVPDLATVIRVKSASILCTNYIDLVYPGSPTTTTTSTTTSTTTLAPTTTSTTTSTTTPALTSTTTTSTSTSTTTPTPTSTTTSTSTSTTTPVPTSTTTTSTSTSTTTPPPTSTTTSTTTTTTTQGLFRSFNFGNAPIEACTGIMSNLWVPVGTPSPTPTGTILYGDAGCTQPWNNTNFIYVTEVGIGKVYQFDNFTGTVGTYVADC